MAGGHQIKDTLSRGYSSCHQTYLISLPEEAGLSSAPEGQFDRLGFSLQTLHQALAKRLRYDPREKGAVFTQIDPDSPTYATGLRAGDLIKEVNWKRVASADEFVDVVSKLPPGGTILVHVRRGPRHFFAAFEMR